MKAKQHQCGPQMQRDGGDETKNKQTKNSCYQIEATTRWQRGGAGGGPTPTSVHFSFICLISSDAPDARAKGRNSRLSLNIPAWLPNNPAILEKSYIKRSVITLPIVFGSGRQPQRPAGGTTQEVRCLSSATRTRVSAPCLWISSCRFVPTEDVPWLRWRRRGNRILQLISPEM